MIALLQGWADLKVKLGDMQHAKELATQQVKLARDDYQITSSSPHFLITSLEFQARIFEAAGAVDEARAARDEAKRLSSLPDSCRGICGYQCKGQLCGLDRP